MGKKNIPDYRAIFVAALVFGMLVWGLTTVAKGQELPPDIVPIEQEIQCTEQINDRIEIEKSLMIEAILYKLTLVFSQGRPRNQRVYVRACQQSELGCPARIRGIVDLIVNESIIQGVDPWLIASIAWRESRFDPFAVGDAREERGVMQLNPRGVGSRVRFVRRSERAYRRACRTEPGACQSEVIHQGVSLISRSIERCGTVWSGLRMYNSGRCDYRGSNHYARKVLSDANKLKEWAIEDEC